MPSKKLRSKGRPRGRPRKAEVQGRPRGRPRKAEARGRPRGRPSKAEARGRPKGRPRKAEGRLPPIEGPKLHQFVDFDGDLEFVQLLTDPESDASAHVFEVVIASKTYALKIVRSLMPVSILKLIEFVNIVQVLRRGRG